MSGSCVPCLQIWSEPRPAPGEAGLYGPKWPAHECGDLLMRQAVFIMQVESRPVLRIERRQSDADVVAEICAAIARQISVPFQVNRLKRDEPVPAASVAPVVVRYPE